MGVFDWRRLKINTTTQYSLYLGRQTDSTAVTQIATCLIDTDSVGTTEHCSTLV